MFYDFLSWAGAVIENLCETAFENSRNDRSAVVRAARSLLSSVTRVLLLADSVVVKQLLHAKEKVSSYWLKLTCHSYSTSVQCKVYSISYITRSNTVILTSST